jgi:hypothetical protein
MTISTYFECNGTKIKRQLNFIKLTLDREDIHPISLGQVLTNLITLP